MYYHWNDAKGALSRFEGVFPTVYNVFVIGLWVSDTTPIVVRVEPVDDADVAMEEEQEQQARMRKTSEGIVACKEGKFLVIDDKMTVVIKQE